MTNTYANRLRTAMALQQPTGAWTNGFGYDAARRLTNVTSQAGTFSYFYPSSGSQGLISEIMLPNTSYITNTYDSVARLVTTRLKNSGGSFLDAADYAYNTANQRTRFTNAATTIYQYSYDNIGQLKIADGTTDTEDRGYTYDTAWNLHYRTNIYSTVTFTVDGKNQLTGAPTGTQTFDNNGNTATSASGHNGFSYDDENRLVLWTYAQSVGSQTDGDLKTSFAYDGLGRLRKRLEYILSCPNLEDGPEQISGGDFQIDVGGGGSGCTYELVSETDYIYDGMRVIQERDGNNTPQVSYPRGTDLSGSLEGAGGIGGLLGRSSGYSGGNWTSHAFYHADGNGNITYIVDGSQALAASYRYDPFGNTISSSGTLASANVYRFSSKEIHVNSGMYYYLYRFYDPNLQRWIDRDPIEEPGFELIGRHKGGDESERGNLFAFVKNEPLSEVDALGLKLWKCSRGSDFGLGTQHVYPWDDAAHTTCGRGGNPFYGRGLNKPHDRPSQDKCVEVPNSAGKEAAVMACCQKPRTHIFLPGLHDCHNWFDTCLKSNGLSDPDIYGRVYGPLDFLGEYPPQYISHQFLGGPWP